MSTNRTFGLIGFPLGHSFSKRFYDAKIDSERIADIQYELFPLAEIGDFERLITERPDLEGVNVTIPYKISVLPYLDSISEEAKAIGAVNCIRIIRDGTPYAVSSRGFTLRGYNTDVYGFVHSLKPLLERCFPGPARNNLKALILGDGGAAKAVYAGLRSLEIPFVSVSRSPSADLDYPQISYSHLNPEFVKDHLLIINTTPLGTFPDLGSCPDIPYEALHAAHLLYDLVYNPAESRFLQNGRARGATIKNGYEMLELQADRNWDIWMEEEGK